MTSYRIEHTTTYTYDAEVTGISIVQVERAKLDASALALPWEQARPCWRPDDPDAWEATDFTFPSPYVEIPPGMAEYVRSSFPAGRPIGEAAVELMQRVNTDFTYKSGSTKVSTKVGDLLRDRTGVCQDFSHFMVSALSLIHI